MQRCVTIAAIVFAACSPPAPDTQPDRPHPEIDRAFEQDRTGWPALHEAALEGDLAAVRELVENGADLRAKNADSQWTALHIAALYDKERVLAYLVDSWKEQFGEPPGLNDLLFTAVIHGNQYSAQYLLEQGANPNQVSHDFEPQLRVAATHGHQETLVLLLKHGADVHAVTTGGLTALHGAAEKGAEGVRVLLEYGADVNAQADNGYTPLHTAAEHGHAEAVRVLLENGADAEARDSEGRVAEDIALQKGHVEVVRALRESPGIATPERGNDTIPSR